MALPRMNSFFFEADSSCPVPRPAPELLEIVLKQREGNPNWRAKYIVATKVTHQDKFRQRPHHAVHSCQRIWLGEIHTLTTPDGSTKYLDSESDDEPPPPPPPSSHAHAQAAKAKKEAKAKQQQQQQQPSTMPPNAAGGMGMGMAGAKMTPVGVSLPTVSPAAASAAAAAVAAASAAAASEAASGTAPGSSPPHLLPFLPNATQQTTGQAQPGTSPAASTSSPAAATQTQQVPTASAPSSASSVAAPSSSSAAASSGAPSVPTLSPEIVQRLMQPLMGNMNMGMGGMPTMPTMPNPYLPGWMQPNLANPAQPPLLGNPLQNFLLQTFPTLNPYHRPSVVIKQRADGKRVRLPILPDLLICMRPNEDYGPNRAPLLFVQTHGGQEYLLLKHRGTYVIDVPPECEVLSVRISMKNEKPKSLKVWPFDMSQQAPHIAQGQEDLEDVTKSLPPGLHVPIIYPPQNGDSPFHLLYMDKELHPTLPTVVLHQLHEPQHLHTEQTFYITPLHKAQRKIKRNLLPPPPSKPSASKQQMIHQAAAGVISAIATGGNVEQASANLAQTKSKKRPTKKKEGETTPGAEGQTMDGEGAAAAGAVPPQLPLASDQADEASRKRKREDGQPSPSAPASGLAPGAGLTPPNLPTMNPLDMTNAMAAMKKKLDEDVYVTDEEENGEGGRVKRRRKAARIFADLNIAPTPNVNQLIEQHTADWLTKVVRIIWDEVRAQPDFKYQTWPKEDATGKGEAESGDANKTADESNLGPDGQPMETLASNELPRYARPQIDYSQIIEHKLPQDSTTAPKPSTDDLVSLWDFTVQHMLKRRVVTLDDLDLRSLWMKPQELMLQGWPSLRSMKMPDGTQAGSGSAAAGQSNAPAFPMFPMLGMNMNMPAFPFPFPNMNAQPSGDSQSASSADASSGSNSAGGAAPSGAAGQLPSFPPAVLNQFMANLQAAQAQGQTQPATFNPAMLQSMANMQQQQQQQQ